MLPMDTAATLKFKLREPVKAPMTALLIKVTMPVSAAFMSSVEFCSALAFCRVNVPEVRFVPEKVLAAFKYTKAPDPSSKVAFGPPLMTLLKLWTRPLPKLPLPMPVSV